MDGSMGLALLGTLAGLSAVMAYATATLVKWASEARTRVHAGTVAFLLGMMAEMLAGGLLYVLHPSESTAVGGLWLAAGAMSMSVFPLFVLLAREVRRRGDEGAAYAPTRAPSSRSFLGLLVGLVLANEVLMGAVFSLATGAPLWTPGTAAGSGLLASLVAAVDSPWFLLTMAAEMFATTIFLRDRLPRPAVIVLLVQSVIMLFSPPAFATAAWVELAVLTSSGLMIALVVYLLEHLYRHRQLTSGFSLYLLELLAVYGLMMAGLFLWQVGATGGVFALAIVLEMVIFLGAVLRPERLGEGLDAPWQLRPAWTFGVLASVFLAELFMGAVLDVQLQPSVYPAVFPALPLSGPVSTVLGNAVTNGFWFVATVTASTWFLAMMGLEMGALVVFKIRESKNVENRIRLGLMVGSYAAFAVFYPSVYLTLVFPQSPNASQVPVLGWSMGLGSYPVAPLVFGAIVLTYAITGSLAALFGRRVVCSVLCTAPLMYQGTTIDAMRSFNRSSRGGRQYLSSRLRSLYAATNGVTMAALVFVTSASYLNSIGRWNFTILGADPSVFFFAFSFSVLWYVMFVAIPYVGDYNCVTMGWCYTGTIVQAFQKLGVYRLKVRSRAVCQACTTVDCATACPVGLVDMPGHFRTTGEFRSSKCCGVGNCVGACPYGNLYIYDVRHWFREHLGRQGTPASARGVTSRSRTISARPTTSAPSTAGVGVGRPVFTPSPVGPTLPVLGDLHP